MVVGKTSRKIQEGSKVDGVDPRKNSRSLREGGKGCMWTSGHCAGNSEKEHGLLAASHCASRWGGVTLSCLPTLQQFSLGGLHLVGIDGTRRREQQKRKGTAAGGARPVEANTNGERPTEYWCSSVSMPMKRGCSKRTQRRKGNVTI